MTFLSLCKVLASFSKEKRNQGSDRNAKKVDFKKAYKDLYLPKTKPVLFDVPPMNFLMIDGAGDPNQEEYQQAVGALYAPDLHD